MVHENGRVIFSSRPPISFSKVKRAQKYQPGIFLFPSSYWPASITLHKSYDNVTQSASATGYRQCFKWHRQKCLACARAKKPMVERLIETWRFT